MNPNQQQPQQPNQQPAGPPVNQPPRVPGTQGMAQSAVPVHTKTNPISTQNALQIAEIRDGIVIMNDGTFRAVVECKSINFDLMSPQEREAVEFSYQGFLNSLYFNIQVFIRSQKIDLRPYIQRLDKIRKEHDNMLLAYLMEDYIGYMTAIAEQTNIMDKRFYVVIPFDPHLNIKEAAKASKNFLTSVFGKKNEKITINETDLEKAKVELKNRIQSVMNGLLNCQVSSVPLDTQELIELYYDAYNPDTATRQKMKNFKNLSAPVVTKGQGIASQPGLERETA